MKTQAEVRAGFKTRFKGFKFEGAGRWTPELRKQKKLENLSESKAKRPAWTDEKRRLAAERTIAMNLKAKARAEDNEERMKKAQDDTLFKRHDYWQNLR